MLPNVSRKGSFDLNRDQREGIRELIETIKKYPSDTIFHLNTWTFGYEDVWVALASAFNTQVTFTPTKIEKRH